MDMETIARLSPIEASANFEGNASLCMFERLRSERIRLQAIDLMEKNYQDPRFAKMYGMASVKSREEIESLYDGTLDKIENDTEIFFHPNKYIGSVCGLIAMNEVDPYTDEPYTTKQKSIIEAHEKGHEIRKYIGPFFQDYFADAFNFQDMDVSDEDVDAVRKIENGQLDNSTKDDIKKGIIKYLSSPMEIAERMSQLKNYFGMNGEDEFTAEHLEYARAHYAEDGGVNNFMRHFFQAITPETQEVFLHKINSSGI